MRNNSKYLDKRWIGRNMKKLFCMSEKWIGYSAAFTATTIFGLTFMFSKMALDLVSPVHLVALRFLFSTVILSLFAALGVIPIHLKGKRWGALIGLSLFQPVAYFTFETYGLLFGASSEAGLFLALIPVVTAVVSGILLHETISAKQSFFLACSVAGAIFIVLMDGLVLNTGFISKLLFLGAVVSASFFTTCSRKQSKVFSPWEITFVMSWVGAVVFNVWAAIELGLAGELSTYFVPLSHIPFLLSLLFLSGVASIIAFFCTNLALTKIPAYRYAVFDNYSAVVSIIAGTLFLQETIQWYQWLGGAVILLGVWGTNYFQPGQRKKAGQ